MTGLEYQSALTTLGLTTEQAAKWLGIGRSTAFRYAVDGAPGPVARCLRVAVAVMALNDHWLSSYGSTVTSKDLTAAVGLPD